MVQQPSQCNKPPPPWKVFQCSPHWANWTKPQHTSRLDSVSRLMVLGGGCRTMVRGQTKEGLGHGPITYPTVLPFEPKSTVEPGTLST
jgi:hypothetical protein